MDELLNKSVVSQALTTKWLGRNFHIYTSIDSTNSRLKSLSSQEEPTGTMMLANYQSSGRGRLGRQWHAPAGSSLLFSLLFRPGWPGEHAQWLMMIASLAAVNAIEIETGLKVGVKWPNDIVSGTEPPWLKCGGILLETDFQDSLLRSAVVGIGINVNIAAAQLEQNDFAATSLQVETGRNVPRLPLLVRLLEQLEGMYEAASAGFSPVQKWRSSLVTLDQAVRVEMSAGGDAIEGVAVDTDEMGRLIVRDTAGSMHKITAADVTIRS